MNTSRTLEKTQNYVELGERDIGTQKGRNEVLQEELARSRRLIESLQSKLEESEATVVRQQRMTRVSQFEMQNIESGGTVRVVALAVLVSCPSVLVSCLAVLVSCLAVLNDLLLPRCMS